MCFGYLDSGGDDEVSLRRNHDAYTQLEMHFQVSSPGMWSPTTNSLYPGAGRSPASSRPHHQVVWPGGRSPLLHLPHRRQQDVPPRGRDGRGQSSRQAQLPLLPLLPLHHHDRGHIHCPLSSASETVPDLRLERPRPTERCSLHGQERRLSVDGSDSRPGVVWQQRERYQERVFYSSGLFSKTDLRRQGSRIY